MYLDIYDVDKFVNVNKLPQVTNPITFDKGGQPTSDGVLSVDIFGRDQNSRKERFGYIDLNSHFFHPAIYKNLKRLDKRMAGIISGTVYVEIDSKGELVTSTEEKGQTGLSFLYKNFSKLKFKDTDSMMRKVRTDVLEALNQHETFCTKWVILPPFYRDVNFMAEDKISVDEVNSLYVKLIRLANSLNNNISNAFGGMMYVTETNIQDTLVEIYDYFISDNIKGKNGIFRQALLGKNVDYASRLVISNYVYDAEQPEDENVRFRTSSVPLQYVVGMFKEHIKHYIRNFFGDISNKTKIFVLDDKKEMVEMELDDPKSFYNDRFIEDAFKRFINSGNSRFDRIPLPVKDSKTQRYLMLTGRVGTNIESSDATSFKRHMTWTDLFYIAAIAMTEDKHIIATRYPVTDHLSIVPNKIHISTTFETSPVFHNGVFYPHYPKVVLDHKKPEDLFENTLKLSNVYLSGLGGDYDGDQLSVRPLLTVEANRDAEKLLDKNIMHLTIKGDMNKDVTNETIQVLYNFTK